MLYSLKKNVIKQTLPWETQPVSFLCTEGSHCCGLKKKKKKLGAIISTLMGLVDEVDRSHSACEMLGIAIPGPGCSPQQMMRLSQEALSLHPQLPVPQPTCPS